MSYRSETIYLENYPKIVVEKGTIDQIITLMIQGV